jgi:hypothetical protein
VIIHSFLIFCCLKVAFLIRSGTDVHFSFRSNIKG